MIPADAPGQPAYWRDACAALAADPVMAQLMARYPEAQLSSRGEPFVTLVRAIVGQQISTPAPPMRWARLLAAVPQLSPEALLAIAPDALRAVGLSARKVEYAHDLARHFAEGRIDPARFQALDDETLIAELVAVRGIGRWTAEMFLIFNQLRADVWPVDDIGGLQRAVGRHYLAGDTPTPKPCAPLASALRRGARWPPGICGAVWTRRRCCIKRCRIRLTLLRGLAVSAKHTAVLSGVQAGPSHHSDRLWPERRDDLSLFLLHNHLPACVITHHTDGNPRRRISPQSRRPDM